MPYIGQGLTEGRRRLHNFVATSNQTTFTATYDVGYIDVYQNGILLTSTDYTATNGTTVVLAVGASSSDEITIIAHQIFSITDTVSATTGGTFGGNVDVTGNITTTGSLRGPSSFTIDPATHGDNTGTVVIAGDLTVNGTTTTINSTTLTVDDKNLILASGTSNSSTADGSGLTIDLGSDGTATMVYTHATTSIDFNKDIKSPGATFNGTVVLTGTNKIRLNTDDMDMYHYGGNNWFNSNTGDVSFQIKEVDHDFVVKASSSGSFSSPATMVDYIKAEGSTGEAQLYYYGSEKLATKSTGIDVTGVLTTDGATHNGDVTFTGANYNVVWDKSDNALEFGDDAKLTFGAGNDLTVYSAGSSVYAKATAQLHMWATNFYLSKEDGSKNSIYCNPDGLVLLYHNGSQKFETNLSGVAVYGKLALNGGGTVSSNGTTDTVVLSGSTAVDLGGNITLHGQSHSNASQIFFKNGSTNVMTVAGGNVGIGSTSPAVALDVVGDVAVTSGTDAKVTINDNIGEVGAGNLAFQASNSAGNALKPLGFRGEDIRFATGSAERMRIEDTGIDVSGSVTADTQVKVLGSNASSVAFSVGDAGTGWYNAGSNAIALSSNGTPSIWVTSGGNVGIGVNTPAEPLDVQGADNGIIVRSAVNNRPKISLINGTSTMLTLSANGSLAYIGDGSNVNRYMSFAGGNVNILGTLYYGGIAYTGGGYYIVQQSDDILKVRTGNIPDALSKISQLNGFYYTDSDQVTDLIKGIDEDNNQTYHEKTTEQKVGVSAQELQKVLPEVVEDMEASRSKTETVYKGVNYEKIVPLLIEGMKELKTTVETLQAKIAELESA